MNDLRIVTTVCSGNLCRSPLAETLLRKHLVALGVDDVVVQSAGTIATPGQRALGESRRAAELLGGDLTHHRTSLLDRVTLEESELVLCATGAHVEEIRRRWPDTPDDKLHLFAEGIGDDAPEDVEDPYGFDLAMFLLIGRVIDGAMSAWAQRLVREPWAD